MVSQATTESQTPQEYAAPSTIEEALRSIADGDATILAGGTDLMLQTKPGGRLPYRRKLVNIRRIAGLRGVGEKDGRISIGALVTITDIANNELLKTAAPVLPQTADCFASGQIRNMGTVGGNICNASPAGDMIVPLLVLDAEVELSAWAKGAVATRLVPLSKFFTGPGRTVKQPNELLTRIVFARPDKKYSVGYIKSGPRPALEISTVSAALSAIRDNDKLSSVRIALGAVGPTVLRAVKAEAYLEGKTVNAQVVAETARLAAEDASPIDDVRATAWYRRHLIQVYVKRLLENDSQG
ncbi:MAG: xanthine dehydrogenase family protein subunit M [Sphingomonadales bacterium]|nr:xanthine dehydrogenase family protein subunit M [Sphingomonadales bacterium]